MSLPAEICGIICQQPEIDAAHLRVLSAVSRAFRDEAERLLYTDVCLRNFRHIKSWCRTISRRPFLGQRVAVLSMTMPPQTDIEAEDLGRIVAALGRCTTLRELSVLRDGQKTLPGDAVNAWILEGHPFRLKKFTNTYFQTNLLREFLCEQTEIRVISLRPKEHMEISIPDEALPDLASVDVTADLVRSMGEGAWHPRNLEHLQYHLAGSDDDEELNTFVALTPLSGKLKSLSIQRTAATSGLEIAILVACAAAQLPDIKHLRILDHTKISCDATVPFLPFPIRFNCIETLVLQPMLRILPNNSEITAYCDLRGPVCRYLSAGRIMEAIPTLKRLVLVISAYYVFRRTEAGEVVYEGTESPDDDEWMKV